MNMKEEEEMAYIAGLIDGDGSICFVKNKSRGSIVYHPVIQLHNSIKEMPSYLHNIFGGTLAVDKPKKEHYKPVHKWMMQGYVGCLNVLEKVSQYLITKKKPALKLLTFLRTQVPKEGKFFRYDQEVQEVESIYLSLKMLTRNRKSEISLIDKKNKKCKEDDYFWPYLAGLMDTDGSFSIMRTTRKPSAENRQVKDYVSYRPCIQLTMITGENLNHIISNTLCGNVNVITAKSALKGIAYKFNVRSKSDVIEICNKLLPYVRFKKKQLEILIDFCENYIAGKSGRDTASQEQKEFREYCYNEIIRLNKNTLS